MADADHHVGPPRRPSDTTGVEQMPYTSVAEDTLHSMLTSAARSMAIRYTILLPKIKAAGFFQPEDHVSAKHIDGSLQARVGRVALGGAHMASVFASGTILFVGQEFALRRLEPDTMGDFGKASPESSALAGSVGGFGYALWSTSTAALLHTGELSRAKLQFLRRALPYTLPRDCGGFGLYFGAYAVTQKLLQSEQSDAPASCKAPSSTASAATGAPVPSLVEAIWPGATPLGLLRNAGATAFSGGVSGLATYLWRSPWDTKYKRSVGWRGDDAPLWSWRRFLQSPRGLKAIGLGAATWSAYELADAVLRKLAGT